MASDFSGDYDHHVGGSYRRSNADDRLAVANPYSGEEWATVPNGTDEDVDDAITTAREAFESDDWRGITPSERATLLHEIADTIAEYAAELAELETRQTGKPIRDMEGLMALLPRWFRYYAGLCEVSSGAVLPVDGAPDQQFNYTTTEPYGVVGAITPWNSPLNLTVSKLAPALAAGNTFVHKPSEKTPVSALRFAELLSAHTDLPPGAYNVVTGDGERTGSALTTHGGIDKFAFTGSTTVGREIGRNAGDQLVPVSLELGGKSPNIVFPSATVDNAVNGIMKGIFSSSGQACFAGSRAFVHDAVYDDVVEALLERVDWITAGDPLDPETEFGPIAFEAQREKIRRYIERGQEEGATLLYGGGEPDGVPEGRFVEPTIFADVSNDMAIAQDEIFGPVLCLIRFDDEAEVIEAANDTRYGLTAGVWSNDPAQIHRVSNRIRAGVIWVNEYRLGSPRAPFGGYDDSGLGRENGMEGLDEYRQTKTVWIDHSDTVANPFD
ncbi:aldehyde dehydrogenase [Halovivax limisalsi]|uniref:aldehyde dehydrogenase n=1 Tax=Halovivax limisalsi TaxID=1453760 RepID=UPI001FFCEB1E|nr:aldehyde dehydrogenase [Halovivax limisalsi]